MMFSQVHSTILQRMDVQVDQDIPAVLRLLAEHQVQDLNQTVP